MSLSDREHEGNRFSFIVNFNKTAGLLPNHPSLNETQKKIFEEFKEELTDEMILHFKQRYMEAKAYGEKNPMSYLVFEPGQYVNYMEVFPRTSKLLDFSYKDEKHFAEDSYELDPRNDNKSIRLTFFKFDPNEEKQPPLFTYTYYFNEGKREAEDASLDQKQMDILMQFHQFIPNLHEILKERYKETKQIGEELLKTAPDMKFEAHKTQRNELCPCGSGKKYKKCCALKVN